MEALLAFLKWIFDLIIAAFNFIFSPLIAAFTQFSRDATNAAISMFNHNSQSPIEIGGMETVQSFLNMLLSHSFFYIVLGLFIALRIIGATIAYILAGFAELTNKLGTIIAGALAGLVYGAIIGGGMASLSWLIGNILYFVLPDSSELWREARALAIVSTSVTVFTFMAKKFGTGTQTDAAGILLAILGLALGFAALAFQNNVWMGFFIAAVGLILAGVSAYITWRSVTHVARFADDNIPNAFEFIPSSFSLIALLLAVGNFGCAIANLEKEVGLP